MDLILINAKVITMDKANPLAQALAVNNGKFIEIGKNEDILKLQTETTNIIDCKDKMVLPGFNDSHMHLVNYGYSLQKVDLSGVSSINRLIDKVKLFINENSIKSDEWILGQGWNQDNFDLKEFPTRYDLDKISTQYPICLTRSCGHVIVVNSKALEVCNINKNTKQVAGGKFDIDLDKEPTGIFRENSLELIYSKLKQYNTNEIKKMILDASNIALSYGITSVQTDDFEALSDKNFKNIINAYENLKKKKELKLRVYEQCLFNEIDKIDEFIRLGYNTGYGDEHFKIGPLKLLVDGSLGARTAYLSQPYEDDKNTCGICTINQDELDKLISNAHFKNMQIAIHCIGDKAMYMALSSIKKAISQYPKINHRHGIVHCQITDKYLIDKYKELDLIAYIQPIFLDNDIHIIEDRIGKQRSKYAYNWKRFLDCGINVAFGSDCPVAPLDVLKGIYCAIERKDLKGYPSGGWLKSERLTLDEALYGFTMGGAYASFEEDIKGSIQKNKLADFIVLSEDLYNIESKNIKDVFVEMTFVDGNLVYSKYI